MDKFAQIISASRDAAHPTAEQARSGNYKKGRVDLFGLKIAIETAQGTRRVGKTDGEPWSVISQAHYGEITGTKGADGDPLDVFIGPWPETELVYVINQNGKDDRFDEHKICLCFPSEESARNAYMNSYERGWNGLGSLVRCTVEQLKWWLKFGNTQLPLDAKALPFDGNLEMMTTVWDSAANPVGTDVAGLIYALRRTDADGLLLDAVTVADILEDADSVLALDALVVPLNKLERKMQQLQVIMAGVSDTLKPVAMQVTSPFKQRGTTNVAAVFELSDGQTISIFFHNPDTTPNKLTPDDEMVSWKWLLNKKDVTILVAPEKGRDLNPREVGRRIMRLADKNSTRFAAANAKKAERMQAIEGLKQVTASKEAELAKLQAEIAELTPRVEAKRRTQAPEALGQGGGDLTARNQAVKSALSALGWNTTPSSTEAMLDIDGSRYSVKSTQVKGAIEWRDMSTLIATDDLSKTPEAFAAELDAAFRSSIAEAREQVSGNGVGILEVATAMRVVGSGAAWHLDAGVNHVVNKGVENGWVSRRSTTQADWTQAGIDALNAAKAAGGGEPAPESKPEFQVTASALASATEKAIPFGKLYSDGDYRRQIANLTKAMIAMGFKKWQAEMVIESAKTEAARNSNGRMTFLSAARVVQAARARGWVSEAVAAPASEDSSPQLVYMQKVRQALVALGYDDSGAGNMLIKRDGNRTASIKSIDSGEADQRFLVTVLVNGAQVHDAEITADGETPPTALAKRIDEEAQSAGEDPVIEEAARLVREAKGGVAKLATSDYFTFEFEGEDLILSDDMRAEVEKILGEPVKEVKLPGLEGQLSLVPSSFGGNATIFGISAILKSAGWVERGSMTWDRGGWHIAMTGGELVVSSYADGKLVEVGRVPVGEDDGAAVKAIEDLIAAATPAAEDPDAAEQAKYTPFDRSRVKLPTARQLSLNTFSLRKVAFEGKDGWTNGHVLDLAIPKLVQKAIDDYHAGGDNLAVIAQDAVSRVMPRNATIRIEPIAFYDDEQADMASMAKAARGAIRGSASRKDVKRVKLNHIVMADAERSMAVVVDAQYFGYFDKTYKQPDYFTTAEGNGPILVKKNGEVVGLMMPVNADRSNALRRGVKASRVEEPTPEPTVEEPEDLFENMELVPAEVRDLLEAANLEDTDYAGLQALLAEVEALGYTFEFDLGGEAHDLRKMTDEEIAARDAKERGESSEATTFLQSVIDGQADMMDPDLADQLTKVAEDFADDDEVMALFNQAAEAYSNFMIAEAKKALA